MIPIEPSWREIQVSIILKNSRWNYQILILLIILQLGDSLEKAKLLSFQSKEQNICGAFTSVIHFSSERTWCPDIQWWHHLVSDLFHYFHSDRRNFYFRWVNRRFRREQKPDRQAEERAHQVMMQKWELERRNLTVSQQNAEIIDSLYYARNIQAAILPKTETITRNFKEAFVLYKPKDIVSGDFTFFRKNLTTKSFLQ